MQPHTAYGLLTLAIICEVMGSTALAKSDDFTKIIPTSITLVCFSIAFYLVSHVIKVISLGITYAIWSGIGIVLTAFIGVFFLRNPLDLPAIIGITFIVIGVVIMNAFSNIATH